MDYNILDTTLKYFTGILPTQYGDSDPLFRTPIINNNDLKTLLDEKFPYGYDIDSNIIQSYDSQGNGTGNIVIYGNYAKTNGGQKTSGFICILDSQCNLLQIMTKYKSGTSFSWILRIDVGDDGNFFGVENVNGTKRFIMLNNICVKLPTESDYNVVLRQSYNLSGESVNLARCSKIIKAPLQAKYLIVGLDSYNSKALATELTINVGISNEWVDYICNTEFTIPRDAIATWELDGTLTFKICGIYIDGSTACHYAEFSGNSNNVGTMTLNDYGVISSYDYFNSVIINNNESYIAIKEGNIYQVKNGQLSLIKETDSYPYLYRINVEVFASYIKSNKTRIARLIENHVYDTDIYNGALTSNFFIVTKQFNLYNYFLQNNDNSYKVQEIYNSNNYNGIPYLNNQALNQNSGVAINDNEIVFARNLYNKVETLNTITSTLNIPNNFANDIYIGNVKLYSKTNIELMDDMRPLITNIYEELMINFMQTMFMTNENNPNNVIENQNGEIRLNHSISIENDYNNAKMTKYRINYSDTTSEIKPTGDNRTIVSGGENDDYAYKTTYYLHVYVPSNKTIDTIDLISNDEQTTYLTIDCSSMQNNKWYKISQDVKINSDYRRV